MRRARMSFKGSFNHVMNKGLNGERIFRDDNMKEVFLKLIEKNKDKFGIKLIAYCIMDNHFHLIVKNENGKLSDFMKKVEGDFGLLYRKINGGVGYVFTSRFKSTLIQEDVYLKTAIVYVLLNPLRAGYTKFLNEYPWSSYNEYFNCLSCKYTDSEIVESLFESPSLLNKYVKNFKISKLKINHTRFGDLLSEDEFIKKAEKKSNRRSIVRKKTFRRINDLELNKIAKLIKAYEKRNNISIKKLSGKTALHRVMRAALLYEIREKLTLSYLEIQKIAPFKKIKVGTLSSIYSRMKNAANAEHRPPTIDIKNK